MCLFFISWTHLLKSRLQQYYSLLQIVSMAYARFHSVFLCNSRIFMNFIASVVTSIFTFQYGFCRRFLFFSLYQPIYRHSHAETMQYSFEEKKTAGIFALCFPLDTWLQSPIIEFMVSKSWDFFRPKSIAEINSNGLFIWQSVLDANEINKKKYDKTHRQSNGTRIERKARQNEGQTCIECHPTWVFVY